MASELDSLRDRIDGADQELLEALARRMKVVEEILRRKEVQGLPLFDAERETRLLTKVASLATEKDLDPNLAERVLREVINHSREVQSRRVHHARNPFLERAHKIAYQGTNGAYSWMACRKYFGNDIEPIGYTSFVEAVDAVESGNVDLAFLPIENVLAGTVYEVYDLLADSNLNVVGEEYLKIEHCLIGLEGTPLDHIRAVLSHPVALQQCTAFIKSLPNASYQSYIDSAEAVRKVKDEGDSTQAAIASAEAADLYGLTVLRRGIADHPENYTRFWIISRDPASVDTRIPAKTSFLLVTDHSEGALVAALSTLSSKGINLTKLESRPRKGIPWQYQFHIEMEGNIDEARIVEALDQVRSRAKVLRVLGCFPSAMVGTTSRAQLEPGEVQSRPFESRDSDSGVQSLPEKMLTSRQILVGSILVGDSSFTTVVSCPLDTESGAVEETLKGLRRLGQSLLRVTGLGSSEKEIDGNFEQIQQLANQHGIPLGCEVQTPGQISLYDSHADVLFLSSRQMQNMSLLEAAGRTSVPIVLERNISSTVQELLSSASTILKLGNQQVILCEGGIRTSESGSRSTIDLGAVLTLKEETRFPVFIDPTQCVSHHKRIPPLVNAARHVGADGTVIQLVRLGDGKNRSTDVTIDTLLSLLEQFKLNP